MKRPPLVTVVVLTTIAAVIWIGYGVYSSFTTTPNLDIPTKTLETLDPNLDTSVLENLPSRLYFAEGSIPTPVATPTPSEEPTPTPLESPQPDLQETQTASSSSATPLQSQ